MTKTPYEIWQGKIAKLRAEFFRLESQLVTMDERREWSPAEIKRYETLVGRWEEIGMEISNLQREGA